MPIINLPTSNHQIIDNDCGADVSSMINPTGNSITFTIKSLKIPPIIQMAVLELDNQCFFQIGDLPSNLLSKNDAFNLTFKKEFSFAVNLPLNNNGFNFQGKDIKSSKINTSKTEYSAKLHITTEEICKLLPILAATELKDLAANLASELLYCRYGRLILTIIDCELFDYKWFGTDEVQNKQEFFLYLLDKYEKSGYSWFSTYNSAPNIYFKTVLGKKVRGLCGNILGKASRKSSNRVFVESSMDEFNSESFDPLTRCFAEVSGESEDNFYSQIIKDLIKMKKGDN